MSGLKEFEKICQTVNWRWELIEDDAAREAAHIEFKSMMEKYQALRLEVVENAPSSNKISVVEMKKIEDVFRKYAPKGYMP